jgi:hypothetical protein
VSNLLEIVEEVTATSLKAFGIVEGNPDGKVFKTALDGFVDALGASVLAERRLADLLLDGDSAADRAEADIAQLAEEVERSLVTMERSAHAAFTGI